LEIFGRLKFFLSEAIGTNYQLIWLPPQPGDSLCWLLLNLEKLIFAGFPSSEVLTNIAQLVESQAEGVRCM